MKLMVLSAVHNVMGGRRYVYKFFCQRMQHIQKRFGVETLVVGSEGWDSKGVTEKYGLHYREHPNNPVSDKWNFGMSVMKQDKFNPDYVMILGSDDLVSDSLIEFYLKVIESGGYDIFGIRDSYYFGLNHKRDKFGVCGYWKGYPHGGMIGYARVFSKAIMEKVDWRPWISGKNSGLDFSVSQKFKDNGVTGTSKTFSIKEKDFLHIDIKTAGNISSMSPLNLEEVDYKELLNKHLQPREADAIIRYASRIIPRYTK